MFIRVRLLLLIYYRQVVNWQSASSTFRISVSRAKSGPNTERLHVNKYLQISRGPLQLIPGSSVALCVHKRTSTVMHTPEKRGLLLVAPQIKAPELVCRWGGFSLWPGQRWRCQQGDFWLHQTRFWLLLSEISAPFANIRAAFILLFKYAPFCKSPSYCSVQLMSVILFNVLSLRRRPSVGFGRAIHWLPVPVSSDKKRSERYSQVF